MNYFKSNKNIIFTYAKPKITINVQNLQFK